MKIIFATKNRGKVKDLNQLFKDNNINHKIIGLNEIENRIKIKETGSTFKENALLKAKVVYKTFKLPVIADDSGLIVQGLDGKPGIFSARYAGENATDKDNYTKLIADTKHLQNKEAYFECALVYINDKGEIFSAEGRCFGEIIDNPRGKNGFGYDPIFFLKDFGKTMAEISSETKNKISHRAKAFDKLIKHFKKAKTENKG